MIIKTNNFESFYGALCHFKSYMFNDTYQVVQNKIDSGEIIIGQPAIDKGQVLILNSGQYSISVK